MSNEDLPAVLAEIADCAGRDVALTLAAQLGGTTVYVAREPRQGTLLARTVGLAAARKIASLYPGFDIKVPLGPMANGRIRARRVEELLGEGQPAQAIARTCGLDVRTVYKIKARLRDREQLPLFPELEGRRP